MVLKKIVVTGGTGFLGRRVVETLSASGADVVSCSRREGVDVRDGVAFGTWLSKVQPDCVVHCAAHVGGIGYVGEHAIEVFHDNLAIGTGLVQGLRQAGVERLLSVMPNCTYPGEKQIYRESEWWDGAIHDSVLMYGLPRKMLWGLCKTYGPVTGLRSAHLILPNLYGPGDHFDPLRSHALGALVRKIVDADRDGSSSVELWGTGAPVREWMFVRDAAEAIARFLETGALDDEASASHAIYNVGIGEGVSIAALAEAIKTAVGWDGSFVFDRTRPDGAMRKLLDGSRFCEMTGWSPAHCLDDGIDETVSWYRAHSASELSHAHS